MSDDLNSLLKTENGIKNREKRQVIERNKKKTKTISWNKNNILSMPRMKEKRLRLVIKGPR